MRLTARVPATTANLGPGFDCLGLALQLYNEVTLDTDAESGVSWEGEGAHELSTDGSDMVSRAIREVAGDSVGGFSLHGVNRIPLERGLGSSSAAAVAGVMLGRALSGADAEDRDAVFHAAADFEGHPDNAAPCVYGGFTIATGARAVRLDPHPDLRPVAVIPVDVRLPTEEARRALPPEVSMEDAVSNLQHAALAVVAFTRDPSLLAEALADRLHQDARLALVPSVREVFERIRNAGIPVCVSGAGPTLMAFPGDGADVSDPGKGWQVLPLTADPAGAALSRG